MRKTNSRLLRFLLSISIIMLIFIPGCKKRLSPNDALTFARVRETVVPFVMDYSISNWQFPESYKAMLAEGLKPPVNPYTGGPMIDTGTEQFDPQTSPGNFHYVPVKDEAGMIGNFSIYVFGKKGLLRHIRPSPLAAD